MLERTTCHLDRNRLCWKCQGLPSSRTRIHTHKPSRHRLHHSLIFLTIAVLDLPLRRKLLTRQLRMREGDSDFYWHSCPKAGSEDGLRSSARFKVDKVPLTMLLSPRTC